ncbi:MAG: hypothetical protein CME60_07515 [Halobacteriovoraceae bacterium]|nr:hypothetical protein [Halobacteriovoraceae bacterium]
MDDTLKHKVLVLDDDPDILQFVKLGFSKYPVDLVMCSTVDEAIDSLGNHIFTLGMIDIVMGEGISSERLIKFIKEEFAGLNRDLPLSIMSAHMNDKYAKKLRLKGSNVYSTLGKPLDLKTFPLELLGLSEKTILIVEDDPDMISLMKNELEEGDYQVFSCCRVELGKRILDLVAVDLLIIDNKLGVDKDCSEFLQMISKSYPDLPCILTGKEVQMDYLERDDLNIHGVLTKPIAKNELLTCVNEYFEQKSQNFQKSKNSNEENHSEKTLTGFRFHMDQLKEESENENENIRVDGMGLGNIREEINRISGQRDELNSKDDINRISGDPAQSQDSDRIIIKGEGQSQKNKDFLTVKSLSNASENFSDGKLSLTKESINSRNKNGQTPLMIYSYLGELETVKELIEKGANIQLKSKKGKTCLHYAAFSGNVELLNYLVQFHGLRINERDDQGHTPLYDAIKTGELPMVKACVELGARINYYLEGKSYLTFAVLGGHLDIAKYFKDLGINIQKKDYKGLSPLDYAMRKRNKELVMLLKS